MFILVTQVSLVATVVVGLLCIAAGVAAGFYFCSKLNTNNPLELDISDKKIKNSEALALIDNFQRGTDENTVSGHIDLDVLLVYINEMQTKFEAANKTLSGLEYYFARYDGDINSDPNNEDDDSGRLTTVIYPTYKLGDDHIPFDPQMGMRVIDMNSQYKADLGAKKAIAGSMYDSNNVLNRAHMSPPRKPLTL